MAAANRRERDIKEVIRREYTVESIGDSNDQFVVLFRGPKNTPYFGGAWKIHVVLPSGYPTDPPKLRFKNQNFHPNIALDGGLVCTDILTKEKWSTINANLLQVFEMYLPQLLHTPEPQDALNENAGTLMLNYKETYDKKVEDYRLRYALPHMVGLPPAKEEAAPSNAD